jgi:prolyl 4-hydroxylase
VLDEARRLSAEGRTKAAVELVEQAAAAGDPEALFALANWRLYGLNGPRDATAAHAFLDPAIDAGHAEALRLKATLVANGTGCPSDPGAAMEILAKARAADAVAGRQLDLAAKMRATPPGDQRPLETLSERPLVRCVRALLSPETCAYLIEQAKPRLRSSFVVHPGTKQLIPHPVRTSWGMTFGPSQEDVVVHLINRQIAATSGTSVACGEPLQILRYAPGQEYRPHLDALPAAGNQRDWTVLVYLNEDYDGGDTRFDLAGLRFSGKTGDALIFRNVDEAGESEPMARHAGTPVTRGEKWIASRWIRRHPFDPWEPA